MQNIKAETDDKNTIFIVLFFGLSSFSLFFFSLFCFLEVLMPRHCRANLMESHFKTATFLQHHYGQFSDLRKANKRESTVFQSIVSSDSGIICRGKHDRPPEFSHLLQFPNRAIGSSHQTHAQKSPHISREASIYSGLIRIYATNIATPQLHAPQNDTPQLQDNSNNNKKYK